MNEFGAVPQVRDLTREHGRGQDVVRAVDGADLDVPAGQTLGVVTHDERVAATADRPVSMRDGTFAGDARPAGGTGRLDDMTGLED